MFVLVLGLCRSAIGVVVKVCFLLVLVFALVAILFGLLFLRSRGGLVCLVGSLLIGRRISFFKLLKRFLHFRDYV